VTPEEAVLARLVLAFESLAIPYMVAGSLASSFHGRPRTTHDADIVIDPSPQGLDRLVVELAAAGFYLDPGRARDALARRRQFNAIEMETACKVDLILRKDRPFSRQEFGRRQPAELGAGTRVALATAEDTILSKLEWAKLGGGSERQLADVRGILDVKGPALDRDYIERWAAELGVLDLWRELSAGP